METWKESYNENQNEPGKYAKKFSFFNDQVIFDPLIERGFWDTPKLTIGKLYKAFHEAIIIPFWSLSFTLHTFMTEVPTI